MKPRPDCIGHYSDFMDEDNASYPGSSELLSIGSAVGHKLGLKKIGIHIEALPPGRRSSWPHAESEDEEFVFVIDGHPDVWINGETYPLRPGDFVAFPSGTGLAHSFINNSAFNVRLLAGGEKSSPGNRIIYPLHPERNSQMKSKGFLWEDPPEQIMGSHDGLPDLQRGGKLPERSCLAPIYSERLILRDLVLSDADSIFEFACNHKLYQFTKRTAHATRSDSEQLIKSIRHLNFLGSNEYGFALKDNQEKIIGTVGTRWFSAADKVMEIFFLISEKYWGQGLAHEAAKSLIEYSWQHFDVERIQARCIAENLQSKRVLTKLGMNHEGTLKKSFVKNGESFDLELYSILR